MSDEKPNLTLTDDEINRALRWGRFWTEGVGIEGHSIASDDDRLLVMKLQAAVNGHPDAVLPMPDPDEEATKWRITSHAHLAILMATDRVLGGFAALEVDEKAEEAMGVIRTLRMVEEWAKSLRPQVEQLLENAEAKEAEAGRKGWDEDHCAYGGQVEAYRRLLNLLPANEEDTDGDERD